MTKYCVKGVREFGKMSSRVVFDSGTYFTITRDGYTGSLRSFPRMNDAVDWMIDQMVSRLRSPEEKQEYAKLYPTDFVS